MNGASLQKTGYADPRVARRRSRLDFGLTRAQPNLCRRQGRFARPAAPPTLPWTPKVTKIPCGGKNSRGPCSYRAPKKGPKILTALDSQGRERYAMQNSTGSRRGNECFLKIAAS